MLGVSVRGWLFDLVVVRVLASLLFSALALLIAAARERSRPCRA
jgi:hypothetical protein